MIKKMLFLVILCSFFLVGCKDYTEIENMTVVTAISVDRDFNDENLISTAIEVVLFSKDETKVSVIESTGKSFLQSLTNAIKTSGNDLFFGQTQVLIIASDIANQGIYPYVDAIYRGTGLRLNMPILIAKDTQASDILKLKPKTDDIVGINIKKLINANELVSQTNSVPAYKFIDKITSQSIAGTLPVISINKNVENEEYAEIKGVAVFQKDYIYGYLDEKQAMYVDILSNKAKSGVILNEYEFNSTTYKIEKASSKITPKIENGKLSYEFDVSVNLQILEQNSSLQPTDSKMQREEETKIENALQKDIDDIIKVQMQYSGADFLGLGNKVYQKYPKQWTKIGMGNYLSNLDYTISVKCNISSTGLEVKSFEVKG